MRLCQADVIEDSSKSAKLLVRMVEITNVVSKLGRKGYEDRKEVIERRGGPRDSKSLGAFLSISERRNPPQSN